MTHTTNQMRRELASRSNDGFEVALLWNQVTGELTVTAFDSRTGELLELRARRENALDVFHHPFAYAAFKRIEARFEPALAA